MEHRCEKCGKNAPFFTEIYLPYGKKRLTIFLCAHHQWMASTAFLKEAGL